MNMKKEDPESAIKNFMVEDQIDKFIKKCTKMYKALHVLERNKNKDSMIFSRSMDKLMRYFSKKFPQDFGLDGNLNDIALSKDLRDRSGEQLSTTTSVN